MCATAPQSLRQPAAHEHGSNGARPAGRVAIPTALSLLRLLLAAVFPFTGRTAGMVVTLAAATSDGLDGFLARRWRVTTIRGSILDAVTDKVFLWTALGTLLVRGVLPFWLLALLLVRDAVIVPVALTALARGDWTRFEKLNHPLVSQLATLALFGLVVTHLAVPGTTTLHHAVATAAVLLSMAAGVSYSLRIPRLRATPAGPSDQNQK